MSQFASVFVHFSLAWQQQLPLLPRLRSVKSYTLSDYKVLVKTFNLVKFYHIFFLNGSMQTCRFVYKYIVSLSPLIISKFKSNRSCNPCISRINTSLLHISDFSLIRMKLNVLKFSFRSLFHLLDAFKKLLQFIIFYSITTAFIVVCQRNCMSYKMMYFLYQGQTKAIKFVSIMAIVFHIITF